MVWGDCSVSKVLAMLDRVQCLTPMEKSRPQWHMLGRYRQVESWGSLISQTKQFSKLQAGLCEKPCFLKQGGAFIWYSSLCVYTHTSYMCTHTYTHTYICMHIYACTHTYSHTYTHTCWDQLWFMPCWRILRFSDGCGETESIKVQYWSKEPLGRENISMAL